MVDEVPSVAVTVIPPQPAKATSVTLLGVAMARLDLVGAQPNGAARPRATRTLKAPSWPSARFGALLASDRCPHWSNRAIYWHFDHLFGGRNVQLNVRLAKRDRIWPDRESRKGAVGSCRRPGHHS